MNRFVDKVVLVTGGASGIGRAACLRFASEGAQVFAVDVDEAGLEQTSKMVRDEGGALRAELCDVTRQSACAQVVASCVDTLGRLDVLPNVAGIVRFSHATQTSEEEWNRLLAVNLSGPFFMSQAAIPHLIASQGNIVNIASNAGLMGQAYTVGYCASKGGLINMSKALAMEFMKTKIRINCVAPAGTTTNLIQTIDFPGELDDKLMSRYRGFRGMSQPEEIVNVVAFLASDEASSVHGAVWEADQGVTAG